MPSLNWIGKEAVEHHQREVPYQLIHCDFSSSAGDPGAGNLLVQDDNLDALKALLPYYGGQVKCINIDPPYNTGKEFGSTMTTPTPPKSALGWDASLEDVLTVYENARAKKLKGITVFRDG